MMFGLIQEEDQDLYWWFGVGSAGAVGEKPQVETERIGQFKKPFQNTRSAAVDHAGVRPNKVSFKGGLMAVGLQSGAHMLGQDSRAETFYRFDYTCGLQSGACSAIQIRGLNAKVMKFLDIFKLLVINQSIDSRDIRIIILDKTKYNLLKYAPHNFGT